MIAAAQFLQPEAITAEDLEDARAMLQGGDGPVLSLREAAQILGVLAADLDLALWRDMGRRHA